jgi:hypothetical protein
MSEQLAQHFKIWGTIGLAKAASMGLEEYHAVASIVALGCGALASLSIAWWHIFKKEK